MRQHYYLNVYVNLNEYPIWKKLIFDQWYPNEIGSLSYLKGVSDEIFLFQLLKMITFNQIIIKYW